MLEAKWKLGLFEDPYRYCDLNRFNKMFITRNILLLHAKWLPKLLSYLKMTAFYIGKERHYRSCGSNG